MTELSGPRLRSLLRQAEKLANAGKLSAAETLYRQIVDETPDLTMGWVGLAGVLRDPAAATEAYQKALALEPDNEAALSGLAHLRGEVPMVEKPKAAFGLPYEPTAVATTDTDSATSATSTEPEVIEFFCANHPKRITGLRCYSCGKPICIECAKSTPVGYSCAQCIYEAQQVFFTTQPLDYVLTALVILPLSLLVGAMVALFLSGILIWFMFVIGGGIGSGIGYLALRIAGRRRGRYMPHFVVGMIVVGAILPALIPLLSGNFYSLIGIGIYLAVAPAAAFYQLR